MSLKRVSDMGANSKNDKLYYMLKDIYYNQDPIEQ
jgi:hypothetical protein